ncbi:hypothetical protein NQ317_001530 [Molorchus minor]|uniref:Uncharacterized protein n=1 Tax=Molorchus minor TaxID=1323400 RepID=A0ABQ9J9N7_9CUCU|nr:hypothetical protein NQ317_001530 [Molorchus minor]
MLMRSAINGVCSRGPPFTPHAPPPALLVITKNGHTLREYRALRAIEQDSHGNMGMTLRGNERLPFEIIKGIAHYKNFIRGRSYNLFN